MPQRPTKATLEAIETELETIRVFARTFKSANGLLFRNGRISTEDETSDLKDNLARFETLLLKASRLHRGH